METTRKIKRYKKGLNGSMQMAWDKKRMAQKGWRVVCEQETKAFNGAKALGLGLIFLPLALMGSSKYIEITFEREI